MTTKFPSWLSFEYHEPMARKGEKHTCRNHGQGSVTFTATYGHDRRWRLLDGTIIQPRDLEFVALLDAA